MSKVQELIAKTKGLKLKVHGDLKEAVTSIEAQLQDIAKLVGIKYETVKDGRVILEANPIGSFDYIREKICNAITALQVFDPDGDGDNDKYNTYIVALYPDRVIVACEDAYYEMTYTIDATGGVTFGDSIPVEQYFTATESNIPCFRSKVARPSPIMKELKESGITITKEAVDMDFDKGFITAHIKEGSFDAKTGEVEVVLIEAGTNPLKKRHYPDSTITESVPIFRGMKMYINHQTVKEENERPERDLRDWVSTIQESYKGTSAAGRSQALGKVYIHDPWLQERMSDPVFARNVGLSINTGGKLSYGKINGEEMQIVEKINPTRSNGSGSVDWVTEAGARGRVIQQVRESAATQETQIEENNMTLKEVKLAQLEAENPALVKEIRESAGNGDAKLAEANNRVVELEKKLKLRDQKDMLKKLLQESNLPEVARDRIVDDLSESLFENEEKLKEAVTGKVKKELEYINSFSPKGKIRVGAAGTGSVKESAGKGGNEALKEAEASLLGRLGIKDKAKDEE